MKGARTLTGRHFPENSSLPTTGSLALRHQITGVELETKRIKRTDD
jgi:hypothetical protein